MASTSLKEKTDYFGLGTTGWAVASTNENRSVGTAEAIGPDGFLVAALSTDQIIQPTVEYFLSADSGTATVKLGEVKEVDSKKIALGSVTINTSAGSPVSMTATGSQIEDGGSAKCTCTVSLTALKSRFHAQDFGLFDVSDGQLTQSTLNIQGEVGTAQKDGKIVASDLTNARLVVSGTVVGVDDKGNIAKPTVTPKTSGVSNAIGYTWSQPLSESNPNGEYPTYTFEITYGLKADGSSTTT